jgi:hypothetical protein
MKRRTPRQILADLAFAIVLGASFGVVFGLYF